MPKLGLCCSQHKGFSGKSNIKDLLGKVGKVSNVLISHLKKKRKISSLFFLPHFCFLFPPQLCSSSFPRLLELFALPFLQLENLPQKNLIRNIYQNPQI